jgi:multicomponent Na+:H+ antiporter subunit D
LGGLYRTRPALAALFLIPALSLAGLPPLSGFFAKLGLVQAGLLQKHYLIVGVSLAVSLLTLFSMIKIWNEAFWKAKEENSNCPADATVGLRGHLFPIALLAGITLIIGLAAGPIFGFAQRAGDQLANPSIYIGIVLQKGTP